MRNKSVRTRTRGTPITTVLTVKAYIIPANEKLVFTEEVVLIPNGAYSDHMIFEYSFD